MLSKVSPEQMEAFADLGYIVLPQVLPQATIEFAKNAIEDLKQREPPPPQGNHAYWLTVCISREVSALPTATS